MSISAKEVQELRQMSGAGMMECKTALSEANGDINSAFKLLREKGAAKAEKKSSRDANEGLIGLKVEKDKASIIEINSETDFVSRNSEFQKLLHDVLDISMKNIDNPEKTIDESSVLVSQAVGKIGENIVLKRLKPMTGNIYSYTHNAVSENLGKIGVLLKLECPVKEINEIGKNISMHIAASSPKSISIDDLDEEIIKNEKDIIMKQLKDNGKPEAILEKMLEGKLNKFYEETTLLSQKFVMDPSISIQKYLDQSAEKIGEKISIKEFLRFEIGV